MTSEQAAQAAHDRFAKKLPGFDPAKILALIQAILDAITGCGLLSPVQLKAAATSPTILGRLRLRRSLRDWGFRPLSHDMDEAVDAILAVGTAASEDDLKAFLGCCN